ncbi:AraC family transcriptional regulator [Faecalibacter macacae]|uniref:AraC family transcriptional regulator n=1 Tax=Faecalibacter macacae TaxID=1859289 RepID=A0A3L9M3J7_9FLAO|nr:AraC family transcriptional regulator [Faecalibacter macacae]
MSKRLIFVILICFLHLSNVLKAEKNDDFYTLLDKSIEKLYQNPEECIVFTQGIILNQQSIERRNLLQNVISQAYAMKGEYIQSIRVSLDVETLDSYNTPSDFAKFYSDYVLAEQYQNLQLYNQSQKLIDQLLKEERPSLKDNANYLITFAKLYQLQALNYLVLKDYTKALEFFNKSDESLKISSKENKILLIENSIFRASVFRQIGHLDESKAQLLNILKDLESNPDYNFLFALASHRLAYVYFLENNYQLAIDVNEKALNRIDNYEYLGMKNVIYSSLAKNYLAINNKEKYKENNTLFSESKVELESNQKEGIRYLLKLTEAHESNSFSYLADSEKSKSFYIGIASCILVVGLLFYLISENKRSIEAKKQFVFFEKQNKKLDQAINSYQQDKLEEIVDEIQIKETKRNLIIGKETEDEILEKLKDFEKSNRFLSKEMSLAVLAGQFETNTKYLSEVINKYKGKNFNSYINELRVNYIAYLMKENPEFLNYKVSYLAEVSGFSSHSSFTTVFKSITGMSPNVYIQQLNQMRNEEV